ncbi:hypothetical protein DFJ58DRAFT_105290 [Suillus subalutaceus]|uniref:uncharacterized protein n=1 Tax=Suillus subalutaceus TaxID=48586 RepID=UPI001B88244F|nr:uncharacterized protein DFJ58DRAFT_105290 [Suillus subalutaceus]KAG1839546.1 hypothetical protein DFJ58DRAFT_105290 [Suillus subalutaceus]
MIRLRFTQHSHIALLFLHCVTARMRLGSVGSSSHDGLVLTSCNLSQFSYDRSPTDPKAQQTWIYQQVCETVQEAYI